MISFNPLVGINESKFSSLSGFGDISSITESSDENYIIQGLDFLSEFNAEYNDLNKHFYKSILESNGDVIGIQESYGDFFSGLKKLIAKFLAFIKNIFDKFVAKLNAFIQNEKYLLKQKETFKRFTSDDDFVTDGYNYSFDPEVPLINLSIHFDSALLGDVEKIGLDKSDAMVDDKAKRAVDKMHADLREKLENGYYDIFRANVIGSRGSISESDFTNECFKMYRSGKSEPDEVIVSRGYIDEALARIEKYKSSIKEIEETKSRINKEYTSIQNKIEKMIKPNSTEVSSNLRNINLVGFDSDSSITDITISYDALSSLDRYLKTISNQVQEMSNIHGIAFATKIDAVKEEYQQDKRILYQALAKCQTNDKAIHSVKESLDNENIESEGSLWII